MSMRRSLFGYNRKDVDLTIENYKLQIEKLNLEIEKLNDENTELTNKNTVLEHRVNINDKASEEITRLALKEASDLIEKAKHNASMILKESLDYVRTLNSEVEGYKERAIEFRANVQKMSQDLLDTIDQSEVFYLIKDADEEPDESNPEYDDEEGV